MAVAEVQRPDRRVGTEEYARRLERAAKGPRDERRPISAGFQRKAGVNTLEQLLPYELVVVHQAPERQPVGNERAGAIAGLLQETAPLEEVVARQRVSSELAAGLEADVERVVAERP